jgi:succinate dehydrogenase / fumarate reductase cytochrome b subunit
MGWLYKSLTSSIGKKFVMAITGFSLISFLVIHLAGNLTLYFGPEAFNGYVETLDIVKPLIRIIEVILALVFIFHILDGTLLYFENKKAKSGRYAINASSKNSSIFSRTMIWTGAIVFVFLVLHLSTMWYSFNFGHSPDPGHLNYYNVLVNWFKDPVYAGFYFVAVIILGFHLNHGFQSAFQTFGWNHVKYFNLIKKLGTLISFIFALGFASFPIYFHLFAGGN